MSRRGSGFDYPALVHRVLRDARRPLSIEEIAAGVQEFEPIHAASPRALVRRIVEQSSLIVPVGGERYGYLPQLLAGNCFRQPLSREARALGFVELSPEMMAALWPGWAGARAEEARPATLLLPNSSLATLRRHVQLVATWGCTASREFWAWLDATDAQPGDDLLTQVIDAENGAYAGELQCRLRRDEQAIAQRNRQLGDRAEGIVRALGGEVLLDRLAPLLIAAGAYAEPIAPDPLPQLLAEDGRFVDAGLGSVALLEGWTPEDERVAEMRQEAMAAAVGEVRPRFRCRPEAVRETVDGRRQAHGPAKSDR